MNSSSPQDRDDIPKELEPASIRDILLPASEFTPDRRLSTAVIGFFTPGRIVTILVVLAIFFLSWMCVWGPLSSPLEKTLNNLASNLPAATETSTTSPTIIPATATSSATPFPSTPTARPTSTKVAPTATSAATDTATPLPSTATPESAVSGCLPSSSINLAHIGQTLCVVGEVVRINEQPTAFYIFVENPVDAFYFVSYDRTWPSLKVGQCIYATGEIDQLGNNPIMILSYTIELEYCP